MCVEKLRAGCTQPAKEMFSDISHVEQLKSRQALWHSVWPGVTIPGTNVGDSDSSALLNGSSSSDSSQSEHSGLGIFGNSVGRENSGRQKQS